jgi:eukaryotic-like serine/threonine-protein kinase
MIGEILSHYRIIEKLGEGGMGVVYRARDKRLDRDIALKVLPPDVALDPERLTRFEREAKAVAALNHPNIVTIHSVEEAGGVHFLTMELVQGKTLAGILAEADCSLDRFFELAVPLADAVNSAHSRGIVHRDLKPANIMLEENGRLKVLDFGLAKLFDPGAGTGFQELERTVDLGELSTVAGKILGTPDYMSPEQAQGKPVDHRTDLFSLGVILYELITGRHPFRGDNPVSTISSILRDTPPPPTELRSELPRHLGRIVSHCLAKETDRRYQSALDLRNDLEELKRETESAQPGSGIEKGTAEPKPLRRRSRFWVVTAVVALTAIATGYWQLRPETGAPVPDSVSSRKMLVVLPFENLGPPNDEYFADGITEEITARLAGVHDLGVIARASAIRYKNTQKTVRDIGKELGVGYILQGTIRWQRISETESRVRVTPQLIEVSDATHLWAEVFQEDMTDIFQVQSNIAEQVVRALDITLMERERGTLASRSTESIEAYHAYLRGLYFRRLPRFDDVTLRMTVRMFERAVDLDPKFALAHCELARAHTAMYQFRHDRTSERLARAKEALDRTIAFQPDLPEAHRVFGWYYYWGFREYDRALSEFTIAAETLKNDAEIHYGQACVLRRQGEWETALVHFQRASELDPQNADIFRSVGNTLGYMRRYAEAEQYLNRSILLVPDQKISFLDKAMLLWLWEGDLAGAHAILREIPEGMAITDSENVEVEILGRDFGAALERLKANPTEFFDYPFSIKPKTLYAGLAYRFKGESEFAIASFDSARRTLEAMTTESPKNPLIQVSLGIAYAGLGRRDEALRAGRLATELLPVKKDAIEGPVLLIGRAHICTMVGEYETALDLVDSLLSIPCKLSVSLLRLDPRWDPLRDQPRFQRILQEYSGGGP